MFARSTWAAVWNSGIHNIKNRITYRNVTIKKLCSNNDANLTPIQMDVAKSQLLHMQKVGMDSAIDTLRVQKIFSDHSHQKIMQWNDPA